jgi:predicted TIM-barrel fold metal-dependent hydrolase
MTQVRFDDIMKMGAARPAGGERTVTFLPEPEPRPVHTPIISVDDHVVEPPDAFVGRLPSRFADRAPRVAEEPGGGHVWLVDGDVDPNVGYAAVVGRPKAEWRMEATRFEEMRRGAWDIEARIRDMDLCGVQASVNFPSHLTGFAGQRFSMRKDPEFALALVRAWNDWHIEAWAGPHPDRVIPCQIPWLTDARQGAEEIRRNAVLGFKAVTFPENPEPLGLPSLHDGTFWDPFFAACEETETVVCLHVGSSSSLLQSSSMAPAEVRGILFPFNAGINAVDWVFSGLCSRFPDLKIVMSEGGIGWVPMVLDRLDHYFEVHRGTELMDAWDDDQLAPAEILQRNFWFCVLEETSVLPLMDRIGVENLVVEMDYPHADSTWPNTQAVLHDLLAGRPDDVVRSICYENAARLFRHPVAVDTLSGGRP